jgi:phosphate transport system substrate-binding protein
VLKPAADTFESLQPEVSLDIGGAGSGTALAGMLAAPDTIGLLSRPMNAREREALQARYGHAPTEVRIAMDAVAIYVFKTNPIAALSLPDLRRAFIGGPEGTVSWGGLGLGGAWADTPVVRYGLERGRGAHDLLREVVLGGADFASEVNVEPVSTSVVQGVGTQPGGIGYASLYFRTPRTRVLPLLHRGEVVEPTADNALSGKYPLARYLYLYVNKPPGQALAPLQRQFIAFVLSRDGQEQVARQGLFALDARTAGESLDKLNAAGPAARKP